MLKIASSFDMVLSQCVNSFSCMSPREIEGFSVTKQSVYSISSRSNFGFFPERFGPSLAVFVTQNFVQIDFTVDL